MFLQSWIKYTSIFHHAIIYILISLDDRTRVYLVTRDDLVQHVINHSIFLLVLLTLYWWPKLNKHVRHIVFTLITVEFLAQYVASLNLWFKTDILTIYWFVWQFSSLVLNWSWSYLLPPILIIEQGSFCVITALIPWMWHQMFYRYLPLTLNLSFLWIFSIVDM